MKVTYDVVRGHLLPIGGRDILFQGVDYDVQCVWALGIASREMQVQRMPADVTERVECVAHG